ncbi:MAG: type II toxin-antitoxin system RelE/ParE family toxin [Coriobacteriales bacterium]|nr:type II toxin-antitoxin system RelE/ParE family toxin [Coriobacteriales bacterium]
MSYLVLRTDTADEQIREIAQYLARVSGNVDVALRFVDRIDEVAASLAEFPERGAVPRWGTLARQGYRCVRAGEYLVLYKTDRREETVTIHAVVHGRREYWRLLGDGE